MTVGKLPHEDPGDLLSGIRNLDARLRAQIRERWERDLPLQELLFDRWQRAASLGFGGGTSIYHESYVFGDVTVGENTWIGPFTLLDGTGGLRIGSWCSISAGVHIYTHDTVAWSLTAGRAPVSRQPVTVGDCTYVGSQTVIAKGVNIGDHAVIGAGSFVNRDVPAHAVAAGSPVRVIGRVEFNAEGDPQLVYERAERSDGADT